MRLVLLFLLWCVATVTPVHAGSDALGYSAFKHIPILHEGRVKPMDTFARAHLYKLHGKQSLNGKPAIEWLANSLFSPNVAAQQKFIRIEQPHLSQALGLPHDKSKLHSYNDVAAAYKTKRDVVIKLIKKGSENLGPYEADFLDFYSAINDYEQIIHALTLLLPSQQEISPDYAKALGLDGGEKNYLDLLKAKEDILALAKKAVKKHGEKLDSYTKEEQEAALLAFYFTSTEAMARGNNLFRVIPAYLSNPHEWYAPWALLQKGHGSPEGSKLLGMWADLAQAYSQGDASAWHDISWNIKEQTTKARKVTNLQITLEIWYNQFNPISVVMLCYVIAFMVLLGSLFSARIPAKPASLFLAFGALVHSVLVIVRVMILERPPVGTLYESILFVALIAVLFAWRLDRKAKSSEGRFIASFLGVCLLAMSGLFAKEGDTLGVLVAVLNTNFWLATHVLCITIGYGAAMVAGTLAHVYLFKLSESIGKKLHAVALIALLFTAIGTILGGIWADQSWGRFWGWDPKENGALAIVIWLVWVLHGRLTGHFKQIGFAGFLCLTNVIVALSWFGVNLLSVGLHSYGFTEGAAFGLGAFCMVEIIITIALVMHAKRLKHAR